MSGEKTTFLESIPEDIHISSLIVFEEFGNFPNKDLADAVYYSKIDSGEGADFTGKNIYTSLLENAIDLNGASYAGKNGYIFIKLASGEILIFRKSETSGIIEQVQKTPEEAIQEISRKEAEKIEKYSLSQRVLEGIMNGIEVVFQSNSQEWFGYIDESDVLPIDTSKFPWSDIPEIAGKKSLHLTELQKLARTYFEKTKSLQTELDPEAIDSKQKNAMNGLEEKYLDYIVGIGSTYEGGSRAFARNEDGSDNVTQAEIESSIESIVKSKTVSECFSYMIRKHVQIEANNGQSTENTRTYEAWNKTLNKAVLEKMKAEKSSDKIFLQYAKLVSGRDIPELVASVQQDLQYGEEISSHSLDTNLFDPESASEALLYVFGREDGILSKIETKIKIEDPKIHEKSDCSNIVKNAIAIIGNKVEGYDPASARGILGNAGFPDVLDLPVGTKYSDLSLDKKMKLSILVRMTEKLSVKSEKIAGEDFGGIFMDIAEDGQQAVINGINENFDGGVFSFGKDSADMGLGGVDAEIFDLYNDIWGNGGLFDPSDFSVEWIRFGAIVGASIIATIALTMLVSPVALPLLAQAGLIGVSAQVTTASLIGVGVSRIAVPESFDSPEEFTLDLVTDITTALVFGYMGGVMTQKTYGIFEKTISTSGKTYLQSALSTQEGRKHMGSLSFDMLVLSIGTEALRNLTVRHESLPLQALSPINIGALGTVDIGIGEAAIEGKDRFIYEDFHNYVALHLDSYLGKSS